MEFLKKNFNAIAGWASIIALITAVPLGFFFWWWGRETQEPIFYVGEQSVLVDQNNVGQAPISILDSNGERVKGNVILTKFYFWNNGKKPIVFEEDVIKSADTGKQEIYVYLTGNDSSRILSNSCTPQSNSEYTGFKDKLDQINSTRLQFTFNVIRHLEGISCQVIFEGNERTGLEIEGALLEVPGRLNSDTSLIRLRGKIWKQQLVRVGNLILFLNILILTVSIYKMVTEKKEYVKKPRPGVIIPMIIILIIVALTEPPNRNRSPDRIKLEALEAVPRDLREKSIENN